MAIEANLYPYFVPQLHNSERQQVNQNISVVDPSLLLLPDSKAYSYNTATNKYNNQAVTPIPQSLAVQFDEQKQTDAVDRFIRSQNEKLRMMIQEQRRQQVGALLKKVESDVLPVLRRKDEQIAQAARKKVELEEFLTRLEAENQSWRRAAHENEAMVLSLHNALEQIQAAPKDVESCCDQNMRSREMEEGIGENRVCYGGVGVGVGGAEQITTQTLACKCCHSQNASFMFLPCRHLCSCKDCETFLQACPVCRMQKKSSIETRIF